MIFKLHETVPLLQPACQKLLLFSKKKYMNENVAHLLCAAHPRWQGQGNCDAFRVSTATRSVVSILGCEAQCHPCLKHLRYGLACKVKQTALNETRLDEHD